MRLQIRTGWQSLRKRRAGLCNAGFTLIELMIVISIILILIGIAAAKYDQVVLRSKEAVLKTDLRTMRDAIDNYTLDKQAAPQYDSVVLSPEQSTTGMVDVHSNSARVSSDGRPYSEW